MKRICLETIESEGLAHYSYYLFDGREALVVDPRKDCRTYTEMAEMDCAKIRYILETHRNEDYVIGLLQLQNSTDAEIAARARIEIFNPTFHLFLTHLCWNMYHGGKYLGFMNYRYPELLR